MPRNRTWHPLSRLCSARIFGVRTALFRGPGRRSCPLLPLPALAVPCERRASGRRPSLTWPKQFPNKKEASAAKQKPLFPFRTSGMLPTPSAGGFRSASGAGLCRSRRKRPGFNRMLRPFLLQSPTICLSRPYPVLSRYFCPGRSFSLSPGDISFIGT